MSQPQCISPSPTSTCLPWLTDYITVCINILEKCLSQKLLKVPRENDLHNELSAFFMTIWWSSHSILRKLIITQKHNINLLFQQEWNVFPHSSHLFPGKMLLADNGYVIQSVRYNASFQLTFFFFIGNLWMELTQRARPFAFRKTTGIISGSDNTKACSPLQ